MDYLPVAGGSGSWFKASRRAVARAASRAGDVRARWACPQAESLQRGPVLRPLGTFAGVGGRVRPRWTPALTEAGGRDGHCLRLGNGAVIVVRGRAARREPRR